MDSRSPDSEGGVSVEPLAPTREKSRRRLMAGLPIALAGVLVVSGVALGAAFLRNGAAATPTQPAGGLGAESPSWPPATQELQSQPTVIQEPSIVETAPVASATPAPTANCAMTLTASVGTPDSGLAPVTFSWTRYRCGGFKQYVVVESPDRTIHVPVVGGSNDFIMFGFDNVGQTGTTYGLLPGTYYFVVVAWNSSDPCDTNGAVLARTNTVKVVVPNVGGRPTSELSVGTDRLIAPAVVSNQCYP